jgi:hypothetical protein
VTRLEATDLSGEQGRDQVVAPVPCSIPFAGPKWSLHSGDDEPGGLTREGVAEASESAGKPRRRAARERPSEAGIERRRATLVHVRQGAQ